MPKVMSPYDLHMVQHYEPMPGSGAQVRLTAVKEYIRISTGHGTLYAKGGQIMGEGGDSVDPIPEWFWIEARKVTPERRAAVGLVLPEEQEEAVLVPAPPRSKKQPVAKAPVPAVVVPPNMYACQESGCGETMPLNKKGIHVMAHRRAARRPVDAVAAG